MKRNPYVQIWKFALPIEDESIIEMPKGAMILCVQVQGDSPCIWAKVSTKAIRASRRLLVVGTGHSFPEGENLYVGSFQLSGGRLVFHVFDGGEA